MSEHEGGAGLSDERLRQIQTTFGYLERACAQGEAPSVVLDAMRDLLTDRVALSDAWHDSLEAVLSFQARTNIAEAQVADALSERDALAEIVLAVAEAHAVEIVNRQVAGEVVGEAFALFDGTIRDKARALLAAIGGGQEGSGDGE